jgi:hypothetical protein
MAPVTRYTHKFSNGREVDVAVIPENKGKHRDNCLCYQRCRFFKPENIAENCALAQHLFEYDVLNDIVTPVWECAVYRSTDEPMEDEGEISNAR